MDKSKEELEQINYRNTLARYNDDLKAVNNTLWLLSALLLVIFASLFYVVPVLLKNKEWYWLVAFVVIGFLFYKIYDSLQKYKNLIEVTIGNLRVSKRQKDGKN